MKMTGKRLLVFLSIAAGLFADKNSPPFKPEAIESYMTKVKGEGVTIAAQAFDDNVEAKRAFGKLNPYEHGVLPVLVVMKNDSGKTLRLENMKVVYVAGRNNR